MTPSPRTPMGFDRLRSPRPHLRLQGLALLWLLSLVPFAVRAQDTTGSISAQISSDPVQTEDGTLWSVVFDIWGRSSSTCVPVFKEMRLEEDVVRIDTWWPFAAPCSLVETEYRFTTPGIELLSGVYTVELWNEELITSQQIPIYEVDGFLLETDPELPVETEPFRITIRGEWSSGCVPAAPQVSVGDGELVVRAQGAPCDVGCTAAITPYSFETAPIGPLDAGDWTVDYRVVDCSPERSIGQRSIEIRPALGLPGCIEASDVMCLDGKVESDRRFEVVADFETDRDGGRSGSAVVVPASDSPLRGGLFSFFDAKNPELLVKVLDGCGINQHWWVFVSALTDVAYTLTVTDTQTGAQWTTANADHQLAEPVADIEALACVSP